MTRDLPRRWRSGFSAFPEFAGSPPAGEVVSRSSAEPGRLSTSAAPGDRRARDSGACSSIGRPNHPTRVSDSVTPAWTGLRFTWKSLKTSGSRWNCERRLYESTSESASLKRGARPMVRPRQTRGHARGTLEINRALAVGTDPPQRIATAPPSEPPERKQNPGLLSARVKTRDVSPLGPPDLTSRARLHPERSMSRDPSQPRPRRGCQMRSRIVREGSRQ